MKTYKNRVPEKVLALLAAAPEPMSSVEISDALQIKRQHAIDVLTRLRKNGRVTRTGTRRGFDYAITKTGGSNDGMGSSAGNLERDISNEEDGDAAPVSPVRSED